MDTTIVQTYHDRLKDLVGSDFEMELLDASLKNLLDKDNKLRFNNFACGIRELSRHVLERLAPDDEILNCVWYKNDTGKVGHLSRGERVKYAIQAGLPDEFIETFLDVEDYKYEVLQAITLLNKYTHVNKDTFAILEIEVDKLSKIVIDAYSGLVNAIIDCRKHLKSELEEHISQALLEHNLYESIDDIDILSSHHNVEGVNVSEYQISELGSTQLLLEVEGHIDVRQQYGSNSDLANDIGFEWNSSFPFSGKMTMKFTPEFPKNADVENFKVNTDSWYK